MAYERKDHFYKRAKREGKISRAVYKLSELQNRFRLVKAGDTVIDLGSAPGGWLQELSPMVGRNGRIIGIDLLPLKISPPQNCTFILGDLLDEKNQDEIERLSGGGVDAVFSDMSPNLSGISFADAYRSFEIASLAFDMCRRLLKDEGNFVVKIFPGQEFHDFIRTIKQNFKKVSAIVPEATRKTSSERYVVAMGFIPPHLRQDLLTA
jgi:23S rRNA (uridine2552-2'-O)-methyltransferase